MKNNISINLPDKEYFTTGETASICAVTPDTVLKWVQAGKIAANRTPGGHHRIHRSALLEVLKARRHEPSPPKEVSRKPFQYCWEFNATNGNIQDGCRKCIVYRSRAGRCFEMAKLPSEAGHSRVFCTKSCDECEYYEMILGHKPNLLVVTDRDDLRTALEEESKEVDCNIRFTHCEYHCSMVIESFSPDWVAIDCSFGPQRSREFAKNISEDPRIPYTRIVLAGEPKAQLEGCDHIVFAFMQRPFTMAGLNDLIGGLSEDGKSMI
jgi:excisionase family DNA binding protein